MNEYELMINRLAQGLVPVNEGIEWFRSLSAEERAKTIDTLRLCCRQSHPLPSEVEPAILEAELKSTFTPCVLLKKEKKPERALDKIARLPEKEHEKAFHLLLALFSIADKRRRETVCRNGCRHEWHHLG